MKQTTPPELEELIESIEREPAPPRPPRRLPRRPLIALAGVLSFVALLALAVPEGFLGVLSDPLRAISLATETISNSISILLR